MASAPATGTRVAPPEDVQLAAAKARVLERVGLAITEPFFAGLGPHAVASKALVEAFLHLAAATSVHYLRRGEDDDLVADLAAAARGAMRDAYAAAAR